MPSDLNSAQIPIQCPQCKHETKQKVGRLRRNPQLTCPRCATSFRIDATKFDKQLRALENELAKALTKTIKLKL